MTPGLARATVRLVDALARENAALASLDLVGATRLLADKIDALAQFQGAAQAERGRPPDARDREIAAELKTHLADNQRLLERAILIQGRVVGTIARAAPRALGDTLGLYARTGAIPAARTLPAVALSSRA